VSVLLDTHTLIWLVESAPLKNRALISIAEAQNARSLFVSAISAWETGLAAQKPNRLLRPNLLGLQPEIWFRRGVRSIGAKVIPIGQEIAQEAARVPFLYGWGDPGDCFLIATAHIRQLTLITRDERILATSKRNLGYLQTLEC
jgi:PIN domain nuclease of toxin-antitoxin system